LYIWWIPDFGGKSYHTIKNFANIVFYNSLTLYTIVDRAFTKGRIGMMNSENADYHERVELVRACLMHVPFDGWSKQTLELAAGDCDIEISQIARILPGGVNQAIEVYARLADEDMVTAFNEMMLDASVKPEGMTAKIKALVLIRLEQASPHKEVVRATLRYLRNPKQAKLGQQLLFQTIDQMWRAAGDDATDFSFYTKRGLLAAVYSATLLYFMADNTGSMDGTSAFLDRRLKEVLKLPKLSKPMQKQASVIASGLGKTVSSIAKNISQQMARRGY
jgi:ubiquinone biosynthesis protein COQ9